MTTRCINEKRIYFVFTYADLFLTGEMIIKRSYQYSNGGCLLYLLEKGQNNLLLNMWNDEICKAVIWLEKRNLL